MRVVAGELLFLPGVLHGEVDLVLLLRLLLLLWLLFFALLLRRVFFRLLAGLAHALAQLLECGDLVGLFLHVQVIDLLF